MQLSLIPGTVDLRQFPVGEAAGIFEQKVRFCDQLHIGVLNAVMDHFHVMPGAVRTDIGTAGGVVSFCGNGLKDLAHSFVSFTGAARHDGRTEPCAFLTSGNADA